MKAFAQRFLFAAVWLSGAISLGACGSQGEGEHCDQLNNSNDCESGLQCSTASICCVPGSAACNAPPAQPSGTDAATLDAAAETMGDAAPGEAAASEASDSGNEAGGDSSSSDGAAE